MSKLITTIKGDLTDALRPFIEKAMDPEYQARRLAEEAAEAANRSRKRQRKAS